MRRLAAGLILSCLLIPCLAHAQRSAGRYGQAPQGGGGGLGGAGGPAAPPVDASEWPNEPLSDFSNRWTSRSAILTPGNDVVYEIPMKSGQTVVAETTSDAFDPSLELQSPSGVKLAENDDRELGNQSPLLICRVIDDATFKLRVPGYKSVAGGRFNLKFTVIESIDSRLGHHSANVSAKLNTGEAVYLRLPVTKDKVYDLGLLNDSDGRVHYRIQVDALLGPTGVRSQDFKFLPAGEGRRVVQLLRDGDLYVQYPVPSLPHLNFRITEVPI